MKKVISMILFISVFAVSAFSVPVSAETQTGVVVNAFDQDFENNLKNFPESYRSLLRALHTYNPNWIFVADKLSMSFDEAVNAEYSGKNNLSEKAVPESWSTNWRSLQPGSFSNGKWNLVESGWYFASKEAIAYYADPRNFLTVDGVFMFAQQSYDKNTQSVEGLKSIIKNTFLEKGYDNDTNGYINDIMSAAQSTKLSPYVIAATIIAEQGSAGASDMISGKYQEYDGKYIGYYNFFNIGVTGDPKIKLGLERAITEGWDSRSKAITGGAKFYAEKYVSVGQSTYYYKDWNFVNAPYYSHQYATNVKDAYNNGNLFSRGLPQNASMTFLIPVFTSIPNEISKSPDTIVRKNVLRGDTNADGKVTLVDLANVQKHLLGIITLSGDNSLGADTNNDGKITIVDLANIQKHLLGLLKLN